MGDFTNISRLEWNRIWKSVPNPITSDDDDKTWFKLIHRALYVRDRNPKAPTWECRAGCGCARESMMHLTECPEHDKVWDKAFQLLSNAGIAPPSGRKWRQRAIITGLWEKERMGPPEALALLRCVWRELYLEITRVETEKREYVWQRVWLYALTRLRAALVARAKQIQNMHAMRQFTNLVNQVSKEEAEKYSGLINMGVTGNYSMPRIKSEIETATAELNDRYARGN